MFAQTGVGFIGGSSIVGDINGQGKGLGNIIDWNPNENLVFSSTATVDISRSILDSSNKFGDYTNQAANVPLSNNSIIDTNIDMHKNYRYKARFDYNITDANGNPQLIFWTGYDFTRSINYLITIKFGSNFFRILCKFVPFIILL